MEIFKIITVLTVLAAAFSYLNLRFLKLPISIGLMVISLLFSLLILLADYIQPGVLSEAKLIIGEVDFKTVILDILLSFLLFAGALHINFEKLRKYIGPIASLASFGVIISTFLVAIFAHFVLSIFGLEVSFIVLLLFGALISPTDPISVLSIMKQSKAPKKLEIKIAGESLFNDGVAVVLFLVLYKMALLGTDTVGIADVLKLFGIEVIGGLLFGWLTGYLCFILMKSISNYEVEVLLTLALVMATYYIATVFHLSGPLAVVVAGLIIGNRARKNAINKETELYLDKFWELTDVFLNAILFVLIGFELLIVEYHFYWLLAGLLLLPLILFARFIAVSIMVRIYSHKLDLVKNTAKILTWGGLRGGISIALALSLEPSMGRELILSLTYTIVVFSILIQGLTVKNVVKKLIAE